MRMLARLDDARARVRPTLLRFGAPTPRHIVTANHTHDTSKKSSAPSAIARRRPASALRCGGMGDSQVSTRIVVVEPSPVAAHGDDCLVVLYPPKSPQYGRRIPLREGLTIGRDPESDLVLPADCVSRQHCRLEQRNGRWCVVDLESKNGTRVGEIEIGTDAMLSSGVTLKVGDTIIKFLAGSDVEAQFLEAVHRMAIEDPLTGLDNRRAFDDAIERELARARRYRRPLGLAMIDIDHFRDINTAVGHVVADVVLQEFARVLRDRIRTGDVLARLGGEELAVLLPEADLAAARRVAEDLRREVEAHRFETSKGLVPVTVSIGVAELEPDMCAEDLLERADQHLFEAKRRGRNRVEG